MPISVFSMFIITCNYNLFMFFVHVCAVLDVTSPDRIPSRLHFVRQLDDVRPERAHGSL